MAYPHSRVVTAAMLGVLSVALLTKSLQGGAIPKLCNSKSETLFILDSSSSISPADYNRQKDMVANVTEAFNVAPDGVRFGLIVFSTFAQLVFGFGDHLTNAAVKQAIKNLPYVGGSTNTADALRLARMEAFSPENGCRQNVSHTVILFTDGYSDFEIETVEQALLLKSSGAKMIVVGIGSSVNSRELNSIASSQSLVFLVASFEELAAAITDLASTICKEQKSAVVLNCISESGCVGKSDGDYRLCDPECQKGYFISCSNEYAYKKQCALGTYKSQNGTSFMARTVYNQETNRCENEVAYCPRNPENYQVPIPPNMNNPQNQNGNIGCLSATEHCLGRPNGNYARCFPDCNNGFYISCSNNETYIMPCPLAKYKDANNRSYTDRMVYVAETDTCEPISHSCPRSTDRHIVAPPVSLPRPSNANETDTPSASTESKQCEEMADVLFIVDASGSIGQSNYNLMLSFIYRLTTNFKIGNSSVQFSLMVYSTDIHLVFGFSEMLDSSQIERAILSAPYLNQGTDTALALFVARMYSFTVHNGARPNASRIVVWVSDGISNSPADTLEEAYQLKDMQVSVMAIGVGPGADKTELTNVASPGLVYEVDNFGVLGAIRSSLVTSACETSKVKSTCIRDNCIGKANGNYAACDPECQDGYYYSCLAGYTYKMPCALGAYNRSSGGNFHAHMVYNPENGKCEHANNNCPRNAEDHQVVPPLASARVPINPYNPECISSLTSCYGRPDGNYPMCYPDCQNGFYISCSNKEAYKMPCAQGSYTDEITKKEFQANLVYDPTSGSCERQVGYCPRNVSKFKINYNPQPIGNPVNDVSDIPTCHNKTDLLIIMDSSGSIGLSNFQAQLTFLADMTEHFVIGQNGVLVSVINFASEQILEFPFDAHLNNQDLRKAILDLRYLGSGTDTAAALRLATDTALTSANGARSDVPKSVIVVTDGASDSRKSSFLKSW